MQGLLCQFRGLGFHGGLSILVLVMKLIPIKFLTFSVRCNVAGRLERGRRCGLRGVLRRSIGSVRGRSRVCRGLISCLSCSRDLEGVFSARVRSSCRGCLGCIGMTSPLLRVPAVCRGRVQDVALCSSGVRIPRKSALLPVSRTRGRR